ncbi:MAG: pyruvoyl-dependent arginine decarboxylase [Candidatus Helarchaeota archaeon]|nr:pyruvoyl-dependent arginine decarboxylase [Candidatus Helarchaeota archaeon]
MEKQIIIVKGIGEGSTALSAFDDALHDAGIDNFNLVELSSIVPKNATIEIRDQFDIPYEVGQIQPVVLSHTESNEKGLEISAGLGWVLASEGGVFIEISGCFGEKECLENINLSLDDMVKRRTWNWDKNINTYTASTIVKDSFTSVVVCAVYTFSKI